MRAASSAGARAADLELAAGEPSLAVALHLARELGQRLPVVAADRDQLDAPAIAAPEPPERLAEGLADGVPDRRVDAAAGDEPEPAIAQDVEGGGARELPAALDLERVLADQPRLDLVAHDGEQLGQRGVLVARVGLADDALARVHAGDHGGAVGHAVVAAREHPRERHAQRDDLDPIDRQAGEPGGSCRVGGSLFEAHERVAR